jgi:outer membrane lipoprotein
MSDAKVSRFLVLGVWLLILSGCAYPIFSSLRQEVNPNVTFSMVLKDPTAYVGAVVLWGGIIVETLNVGPKETDMIVLESPLSWDEKPKAAKYSQGRFIARNPTFLDPMVYRKGRKITLAGQVIGKETKSLGKTQYTYPLVMVKELYLWERERRAYPAPYYYDPWWGPWYSPWYGPWYGPYYFGPGDEDEDDLDRDAD